MALPDAIPALISCAASWHPAGRGYPPEANSSQRNPDARDSLQAESRLGHRLPKVRHHDGIITTSPPMPASMTARPSGPHGSGDLIPRSPWPARKAPQVTSEGEAPAAGPDDSSGSLGEHATFDTSVAHQARMYDCRPGGKDNFAADRKAAEEAIAAFPDFVHLARANRAFLRRVAGVPPCEAGVRQFLDIGTGIPTKGNTHQVAQEVAAGCRVVYVDYDPVVLSYARALLTSSSGPAMTTSTATSGIPGSSWSKAAGKLPGLHQARGRHDARDSARYRRRRRSVRDRAPDHGRDAIRQLPCSFPSRVRYRDGENE